MVGKSEFTNTTTAAVARGHFTLRSSALYFSIHYTGSVYYNKGVSNSKHKQHSFHRVLIFTFTFIFSYSV